MLNKEIWNQLLAGGLHRLPHALLLVGPPGVGKAEFSVQLAALLLCESPGKLLVACGQCQGCHWFTTENHPDFRRIAPESADEAEEGVSEKAKKKSTSILIGQIRALEDFVFVGSHRNGKRIVLVTEADAMNPAAANALLKILEEPPPNVYFILVSSKTRSLLPTIRSRCRAIGFGAPATTDAATWMTENGLGADKARFLDLAGGAPARVLQWEQQGQLPVLDALIDSLSAPPTDPVALAARWDGMIKGDGPFRLENLVDGVQRWIFDLAQESMAGTVRYHRGWARPRDVSRLHAATLIAAWREILQFRRSARHPLNQLLFLENLAAYFLKAVRPVSS
jgi:DNA polymerase-3 subunit delta'